MSNNWPTKKLGEVVKTQNGFAFKSSEYKTSGFFVMRITNVQDGFIEPNNPKYIKEAGNDFEKFVLNENDILISLTGNVGRVGVIQKNHLPAVLNQRVARITVANSNLLYQKYLFYFLKAPFFIVKVIEMGHGMAQKNVSTKDIEKIEIPLPPIGEQKKIVAKLEKVLAKIGEAKKLRAEARENTDNLLSAELHKIFSQQDSYSLIRANKRIVKKWEEKELGEICEKNPKKSEVKNEPDNLGVSFVPMAAVDEFSQEIVSFGERKLGEVRKGYTYFRDGDVLFAKITPCMENGKVAIARDLKNGIGFGTTEFHVIRPRADVLSEWIYAIIRQPEFRDVAKTKMTGSAGQKRVPADFLKNFKIPLPSIAEQKKIVAQLDSLSEKIEKIKKLQNATKIDFTALEQSILHQAFSN